MKTKKESLAEIIRHSSFSEVVALWNKYSKENNGIQIYANDSYFIDGLFKKVSDFAYACKYGEYDYEDDWFYVAKHYNYIFSFNGFNDRRCIIEALKLADYLIENGDYGFPLDEEALEDDFFETYFPNPEDNEKARYIADELSESEPMDFLMEDWLDIYKEIKAHWNG